MTHTEFWDVVDRAFPHGLGRSLVQDLVLPELSSRTAAQALAQNEDPQAVWHALRVAMDLSESYEFLHRVTAKDRKKLLRP